MPQPLLAVFVRLFALTETPTELVQLTFCWPVATAPDNATFVSGEPFAYSELSTSKG
ncbi:MAG TPA: hypothetical protein VIT88_08375 [Pyrinomonadaceae bacterium]